MPSTTTVSGRPLSAEAILASQALESRQRQESHSRKKTEKGKISLAGPVFGADGKLADLEVLGRRADTRVADRREAESKAAMYGAELDKRSRVAEENLDATPEQIARARQHGDAVVIAGVRNLVDPFTSLGCRGSFHADKQTNEALFQAGIRYRTTIRNAGLDGAAKAMDLTKDIVDGGEPMSGMAVSERVAAARQAVREATAAITAAGPNLLPYLDLVVLQDCTIEQTRLQLRPREARSSGRLFTEKQLVEALTILADHWKLMPRNGPRPITACGVDGVRFYEVRRKKVA